MAEILPDALSAFDGKKREIAQQLAQLLSNPRDAIAQLMGQAKDDTSSRNQAVTGALASGDMPGVLAAANQGTAPTVSGSVGAAGQEAIAAARSTLAHYQLPVFDRLIAMTGGNAQQALAQTKKLTSLMSPQPGAAVADLSKSMLSAGVPP